MPTESALYVDLKLRELARDRAKSEHQLCGWLRRGFIEEVHTIGAFASFQQYAERVFKFTSRQTEERLRVAEALENLPELNERFATGDVAWSVVRELTRVATPDNENAWIGATAERTAREVEQLVSGRSLGELPDGPSPPEAVPKRISAKVTPSTYALWKEAKSAMVRESGGSVDDDTFIAMLARQYLGQNEDGRSNYQIAISVCDRCGTAEQRAGGESVVIDAVALEVAQCDAQHIGRVDGEPERATQTVPPATRRAVLARHKHRCAVPGCRHAAFLDLHHTKPRAEGGDHDADFLIPLCPAHHRLEHDGKLVIRGSFSTKFTFEHADGRAYGSPEIDPARAIAFAQLFEVLRGMGYKETEARRLIDAARPHVGAGMTLPELLRETLRRAPVSCMREERAVYQRLAS
jgi:hypothetical protein